MLLLENTAKTKNLDSDTPNADKELGDFIVQL